METNLCLYKLDEEVRLLLGEIWANDGEMPPEQADELTAAMAAHKTKALSCGHWIKSREATIAAARSQVREFEERIRAEQARVDRLKDLLKRVTVERYDGKIEDGLFAVKIHKSPPSLVVFDEAAIPDKYKTERVVVDIDKAAIKEAIKTGEVVPGTQLHQGDYLKIGG